jgi:transcriptional regulator GlxA family with amidase domain
MHTRLNEKLTVNDIAWLCYMNPDSFIRRFSRIVGTTPYAYLKNIRLRTARYLKELGMPLSQIASEVGYSDASALSHALRHPKKT